jgi:hypothetical protein
LFSYVVQTTGSILPGLGIKHTTQRSLRGPPSRRTATGVLNDEYSYDENANVTAITDEIHAMLMRMKVYDDRDRLTGDDVQGVVCPAGTLLSDRWIDYRNKQ